MEKNIQWFKREFLPALQQCNVVYSSFKNGDFGDLDRVELERELIGVTIEFWSLGWLGVHIYDYKMNDTLLNVLLEPNESLEKEEVFRRVQTVLH